MSRVRESEEDKPGELSGVNQVTPLQCQGSQPHVWVSLAELKLINKSVNKGNLPTLILSIQDLSDLIIFAQTQNRMPHSLPGDAGG